MTVLRVLYNPSVLPALLSFLSWDDFQALAATCRRSRALFDASDVLQDAILGRYVPAYAVCRKEADMEVVGRVDVKWEDLVLLNLSQQTALHNYPTHALSVLSGARSYEKMRRTGRLARLTIAHSRFVLLLQSLAHSAAVGPPPPPLLADRLPLTPSAHSTRELVFPAPLAQPSHVRAHTEGSICIPKSKKRLSLLSLGRKQAPPPGPVESRALKYYSSSFGWRNSHSRYHSRPPSEDSEDDSESSFSPLSSATSVDDTPSSALRPTPRPRLHIAQSLASNTRARSILSDPLESTGNNPHALALAASRLRAPILRVFVPCTEMGLTRRNRGEGSPALESCEDELIKAGLWEHLSVGDVVCNLGFVPPLPSQRERTPSPRSLRSRSSTQSQSSQSPPGATWLLFTGERLVPYCPSNFSPSLALLPLDNPLTLPGPQYFDHLFVEPANYPVVQGQRPTQTGPNIRLVIPYIPYVIPIHALRRTPEMTLMEMPLRVPSPHTPGGFAVVRKWVWVTRVHVRRDDIPLSFLSDACAGEGGEHSGLGIGWEGEWILEGDGTKEGRELLLACLDKSSGKRTEWEVVRERMKPGRVWLRLINSSLPALKAPVCQPINSVEDTDTMYTDNPPVPPPKPDVEAMSAIPAPVAPPATRFNVDMDPETDNVPPPPPKTSIKALPLATTVANTLVSSSSLPLVQVRVRGNSRC